MPVDLAKMREKLNKRKKEVEDRKKMGQTFKLTEGENRIRILPPWDETNEWEFEAFYHFNLGNKPLLCLKKQLNEACPICEYTQGLFDTKDSDDKDMAKQIMSKKRYFCGVLNLMETNPTPKMMSYGVELHDFLLASFDPVDGHGDFTDPVKGKNIKIDVVGSKLTRKMTTTMNPNASPIANWTEIKPQVINVYQKLMADKLNAEQLTQVLESVLTVGASDDTPSDEVTEVLPVATVKPAPTPKPAEPVPTAKVETPVTTITAPPATPKNLSARLEALKKLRTTK